MKLAAHYSKSNTLVTLLVLFAGAVIYYFAISYIVQRQLDRDLTEEMDEVLHYVAQQHKLPPQSNMEEDVTTFTETIQTHPGLIYYNTKYKPSIKSSDDDDNIGRAVETIIPLNGKYYKATIVTSGESTEYLVQVIAGITLLLALGLFTILFFTNRYISIGLWKPFFYLLRQLQAFTISENSIHTSGNYKVDEFRELDTAIHMMSSRVRKDYKALKQFTENASHEMMTPLAVITSKLDMLIQDETLNANHYRQIHDIYAATGKLSRLNQSLLLLVKIENNLLEETEEISLDSLMLEKLEQFNELIISKEISITTNLSPRVIIANKSLVDILINNLLSNAIRHNIDKGFIKINLSGNHFSIQNTGSEQNIDLTNVFERFQKGKKSEGVGLGLAIVKNICNTYNWDIFYHHENSIHIFTISY